MKGPLRIALLNDLLPPDSDGGLELSAFEIGMGMRELGHDVQFVCSQWRPAFTGDKDEIAFMHRILRCVETATPNASGLRRKVASFKAIQRKVNVAGENYSILSGWLEKNGSFDVALVFGILGVGLGITKAFTEVGIPLVWSMGDVSIPVHFAMPRQTKLYRAAFATVGRKWHEVEKRVDFSHVMTTTHFVLRELESAGIVPATAEVVPRAINFEIPEPAGLFKSQPPSILIACRISPARGVQVAIEAAKLLAQRRPDLDWNLRIAGGGSADFIDSLKALGEQLGGKLQFLGKLAKANLIEEMKAATIVINPTIEVEGFGRSNIEAMACSAALVATDVPSIHEIAEAGIHAEIVPCGDAPAMSASLERLLTDRTYRDTLTGAARNRVASAFTLPPVLARVEANLRLAAKAKQLSEEKYTSD